MDILKYEKLFTSKGYRNIVGIDEAGRGPLAGPVVAVAINCGTSNLVEGVKDSKKISEKKRFLLYDKILKSVVDVGIGIVHENEIDSINILQATYVAMRKAIKNLKIKPDLLLIDGNRADIKDFKQKNIIKGDSLSYSIACASIIAKVTRDKMMVEYSKVFPVYNFDKHKGYGTKFHLKAIYDNNACPIHRKSFKPISKYLPTLKSFKDDKKIRLLSCQIVAEKMIKKNATIISFNKDFDIVSIKENILSFSSVNVKIGNKTINSKIPLNIVNLDNSIKNFILNLNSESFNKVRIYNIVLELKKDGHKINVKKDNLYDV